MRLTLRQLVDNSNTTILIAQLVVAMPMRTTIKIRKASVAAVKRAQVSINSDKAVLAQVSKAGKSRKA